jgi:hypothetical protein
MKELGAGRRITLKRILGKEGMDLIHLAHDTDQW